MKLQNLTVIFSIIIIPITLILSAYIGSQIDTASLQQSYDTKLMDATHDAVVAFELNTSNNNYSTNADSIRRDIKAAINTFSSSLATGLGVPGANPEYIMPYVPAILITLYDGYYIYSPSEYSYKTKELDGNEWKEINKTGYTHILKPYIYYSAKYKDGNDYIVLNYSLDNYITVYGQIGGEVISKSGYLETTDFLNSISTAENLSETIVYKDSNGNIVGPISCKFIYKDSKKIYNIGGRWYTLTGLDLMPYNGDTNNGQDNSAIQYKEKSQEFMKYINTPINGKKISSIVTPKNCDEIDSTDTTQILLTDPEDQASLFNQHKREVIKTSIQNNLNNAMAIYNANSGSMGTNATFAMPKLSEEDWEKVVTNINVVTFMQGIAVGTKTYNNYSIVTSRNNKQFISTNSIYFVNESESKYHTIYDVGNDEKVIGYKSSDFEKIKYEITNNESTETRYYYRRPEYACYNCVISASNDDDSKSVLDMVKENQNLKVAYYTALARERFNLDKVTKIYM